MGGGGRANVQGMHFHWGGGGANVLHPFYSVCVWGGGGQMSTPASHLGGGGANVLSCHFSWKGNDRTPTRGVKNNSGTMHFDTH